MQNNVAAIWLSSLLLIGISTTSRSNGMEHLIENNDVTIWAETFGDKNDPPLLLIMGGGTQGIMWPVEFCERLAQRFFVIRYDHRDVGLSSKIDFEKHPYDLEDVAKDALAVLDNFGIEQAYIFTCSMGGVITQLLAEKFSERVRAAFIYASSTDLGGLIDAIDNKEHTSKLPKPAEAYLTWVRGLVHNPAQTKEEKIEQHLSGWRLLNGPVFPFEEDVYRPLITDQVNRQGKNEEGVVNHIHAINRWRAKKQPIGHIKRPLYVFWGTEDLIFPTVEHAQSIVDLSDGGELIVIKGMGHQLNVRVYDQIISKVVKEVERIQENL